MEKMGSDGKRMEKTKELEKCQAMSISVFPYSAFTRNTVINERYKSSNLSHTHTHTHTHTAPPMNPEATPALGNARFGNGRLSSARCAPDTFCALPPPTGKPVQDQGANCGFLTLFSHRQAARSEKNYLCNLD